MNIAIIGYGKMGKAVEAYCIERGHTVSFRIGKDNKDEINQVSAVNTDVAIEFSTPAAGFQNCLQLVSNGVKTISGTTGWIEDLEKVESAALKSKTGFLYASNFSIGVNIFFQLNKILAQIMNSYDNYQVSMEEWHHIHKLDAPSGTSITLLQDIVNQIDRIKEFKLIEEQTSFLQPGVIPVKAYREGEIPGTHAIKYGSELDTIEIIHTARKRESFAIGAVLVAEWMRDKTGVFSMDDFLEDSHDK